MLLWLMNLGFAGGEVVFSGLVSGQIIVQYEAEIPVQYEADVTVQSEGEVSA